MRDYDYYDEERHIYFMRPIGQDGPIKIGSSRAPERRLATYMEWSPYPLEIVVSMPGDMRTEWAIHRCFADAHSHDEWFRPIPRLLAAVERLIEGVPLEDAIDLSKQLGEIRPRLRRMKAAKAEMLAAREAAE